MTTVRVDDMSSEMLHLIVAQLEGRDIDPWHLFLREADVMERWGPVYLVHVRLPYKIAGLSAWKSGIDPDPLAACARAYLKTRLGNEIDLTRCEIVPQG